MLEARPLFARLARRALVGAAVVACVASAGCATGSGSSRPAASAPDFTLPSIDGANVRLSDHLDGEHVVLLDFWATTCEPCMTEMPHLVELYKAHKDQGFVVLAISLDGPESLAQVSSMVHDKGMTFPVLLDEETTVTARYNPTRTLPFSVLIGKDGKIIHSQPGYTSGDEKLLKARVVQALAN